MLGKRRKVLVTITPFLALVLKTTSWPVIAALVTGSMPRRDERPPIFIADDVPEYRIQRVLGFGCGLPRSLDLVGIGSVASGRVSQRRGLLPWLNVSASEGGQCGLCPINRSGGACAGSSRLKSLSQARHRSATSRPNRCPRLFVRAGPRSGSRRATCRSRSPASARMV